MVGARLLTVRKFTNKQREEARMVHVVMDYNWRRYEFMFSLMEIQMVTPSL